MVIVWLIFCWRSFRVRQAFTDFGNAQPAKRDVNNRYLTYDRSPGYGHRVRLAGSPVGVAGAMPLTIEQRPTILTRGHVPECSSFAES